MYIKPIKGITIILVALLLGVILLACAPTDPAGNPMQYSSGDAGYSYKIYMGEEVVREGNAVSIGQEDGYAVIDDLWDGYIYTGWENVIIIEN